MRKKERMKEYIFVYINVFLCDTVRHKRMNVDSDYKIFHFAPFSWLSLFKPQVVKLKKTSPEPAIVNFNCELGM